VLRPRQAGDGAALGVTVPVDGAGLPGRGVLVVRGNCTPLQVALVDDGRSR
jgi:hypothetical protein